MNQPRRRDTRKVDGVLLLDKPSGMTSNAALQQVKRLYQATKAGHTGSLDPLAEGLLPICFGEATKLAQFLLNADKSYHFRCRLGVTTTTGDAEGAVVREQPVPLLTRESVETVLQTFCGEIQQLPPMYSALKHRGQRLYDLARQGLVVERQPRTVIIHELQLLNLETGLLDCSVRCSKGTYIRTLAEDIGQALGCGAHVARLRRTALAAYQDLPLVTLGMVQASAEQGSAALDALLLPMDGVLADWPSVQVDDTSAHYLSTGQAVQVTRAPTAGWVMLYRLSQPPSAPQFLGIGEVLDDGRVTPRRIFNLTAAKVSNGL